MTNKAIYQFKLEVKIVQNDASKILPAYKEVKENDTLNLCNVNEQIQVGTEIASKGEGTVFNIDGFRVAKVFHKTRFTEQKMMKIHLLIQHAQVSKSIAYPKGFLKDSDNQLVGYYMPKASGIPLQAFFSPESLSKHFPKWSLSQMLKLALSVSKTVELVHSQNLIIGDLNGNNILVENEEKVVVIDTDSFQINDYSSDVGMIEYTRDIHLNHVSQQGYQSLLRSKYDDIFSLSIIIFQMMLSGQLPFNHKNGEESYMDNIKKGHFPYSCTKRDVASTPNGSKRQWNMTPKPLREYFCKVFKEHKIVSMQKLQDALHNSLASLTT